MSLSRISAETPIGHVVFYAGERLLHELQDAPLKRGSLVTVAVLTAIGVGLIVFGATTLDPRSATIGSFLAMLAGVCVGAVGLLSLRPAPHVAEARVRELEALDDRIKSACHDAGIRCFGCDAASVETFGDGAGVHGFDCDAVIETLNAALELDFSIYAEGETPAARPGPKGA